MRPVVCILALVTLSLGHGNSGNYHDVDGDVTNVKLSFKLESCPQEELTISFLTKDRYLSVRIHCQSLGVSVTGRQTGLYCDFEGYLPGYCDKTCTEQKTLLLQFTKSTRNLTITSSEPKDFLPDSIRCLSAFSSDITDVLLYPANFVAKLDVSILPASLSQK